MLLLGSLMCSFPNLQVPLEGFSALQGISGSQRFQIHKAYGSPRHLPSAHTWYFFFPLSKLWIIFQLVISFFNHVFNPYHVHIFYNIPYDSFSPLFTMLLSHSDFICITSDSTINKLKTPSPTHFNEMPFYCLTWKSQVKPNHWSLAPWWSVSWFPSLPENPSCPMKLDENKIKVNGVSNWTVKFIWWKVFGILTIHDLAHHECF